MQLPEAKAMSEWLALYIKLSESSLNLDLDLGLEINITYQSHTYRMVFYGRHYDHIIIIIARTVLACRVWGKAVTCI